MNYIILSSKPWNNELAKELSKKTGGNWTHISKKEEFTKEHLAVLKPEKIFIPHWSYIIPVQIVETYECIVFHMTDLPFGRGGSPLQNLISRGLDYTKITAIRIDEGIDTGDIYLKKDLSLFGTAEEIFIRANKVIEEMIIDILDKNLSPVPQIGIPVQFKRRSPDMSDIKEIDTIESLYNHVRMLDAEGYPNAFMETEYFKFEFSRASLKADGSIIADVRIIAKQK